MCAGMPQRGCLTGYNDRRQEASPIRLLAHQSQVGPTEEAQARYEQTGDSPDLGRSGAAFLSKTSSARPIRWAGMCHIRTFTAGLVMAKSALGYAPSTLSSSLTSLRSGMSNPSVYEA
jgi:hypothetical protein